MDIDEKLLGSGTAEAHHLSYSATGTDTTINLSKSKLSIFSGSDSEGLDFLNQDGLQEPLPKWKKDNNASSRKVSFQELGELYDDEEKNALIWSTISFSKDLLNENPSNIKALAAFMLNEIDHDFFTRYEDFAINDKSWQKKTIPYVRGLLHQDLVFLYL
jgi:hypothetical protein